MGWEVSGLEALVTQYRRLSLGKKLAFPWSSSLKRWSGKQINPPSWGGNQESSFELWTWRRVALWRFCQLWCLWGFELVLPAYWGISPGWEINVKAPLKMRLKKKKRKCRRESLWTSQHIEQIAELEPWEVQIERIFKEHF